MLFVAKQDIFQLNKGTKSEFLSVLFLQDSLQVVNELSIVGKDLMRTSRMFFGNIIGCFPLMNKEFIRIFVPIIAIMSSSKLDIIKSDPSTKSTKVGVLKFPILKEIENFSALGILNFDDLRSGLSYTNGVIGNWAPVIERVIGPVVVQQHYDMFNIMVEINLN